MTTRPRTPTKLPPGQRAVIGFPRFGIDRHSPPPATASEISIDITGAVTGAVTLSAATLGPLPRTSIDADFHCVAGWSATGLRWEERHRYLPSWVTRPLYRLVVRLPAPRAER